MENKACLLLKVDKKDLIYDLSITDLIMCSEVLYDDHIDTNISCMAGIIVNTNYLNSLPSAVSECISTEFPKLKENEVIYVEIYSTEE